MVALQHLVDEDAEALVDRRLARDPEDARELVLQRARPVGLDVGRAQQQAVAAAWAGTAPATARCAPRPPARAAARRARRRAGSRRARDVSKISRCSEVEACSSRSVDLGQRLLDRQLARARALQQRAQLDQLEVADDGVRDVEVGVEAQLAEPAADLRDRRQQLVAQQPERRLQRLGRAEELLLARLPLARRPPRAPPRRTATAAAPRRGRSARDRRARAAARARDIATCSSRRISAACAARESGGTVSLISASGIGSSDWRRGPGIRALISPST